MPRFIRATEPKGKVHWINLDHVRVISLEPAVGSQPATTAIHIDSYWFERRLVVVETPDQLLADVR